MKQRLPLARAVVAVVVVVAALAGAFRRNAQAEVGPPPVMEKSGLERRLGALLPVEARFRSSAGRDTALGELFGRGKPALLILAYNRCTMLCSLVLRRVARLVPELGLRAGDDYALVTISIDPRDTPLEAGRLQGLLLETAGMPGERGRWPFLVGERSAIDAVANAVGFRYAWDEQTEQYAHPAAIIAVGPDGAVSGYFDGLDPDPGAVRATLLGSRQSPRRFAAILSSCFRFDASRSRYAAPLSWVLRGSAAGLSFGLGLLLWRLGRRHPSQGGERS